VATYQKRSTQRKRPIEIRLGNSARLDYELIDQIAEKRLMAWPEK